MQHANGSLGEALGKPWGSLGEALAASASGGCKGKNGHYPYYLCRHRGCSDYAKSVPRAKMEDAFEAMLQSLTPARQLVDLATDAFRNLWNRQMLKAGSSCPPICP